MAERDANIDLNCFESRESCRRSFGWRYMAIWKSVFATLDASTFWRAHLEHHIHWQIHKSFQLSQTPSQFPSTISFSVRNLKFLGHLDSEKTKSIYLNISGSKHLLLALNLMKSPRADSVGIETSSPFSAFSGCKLWLDPEDISEQMKVPLTSKFESGPKSTGLLAKVTCRNVTMALHNDTITGWEFQNFY